MLKKGKDLWLVVLKEHNKGYCWHLCRLDCDTKKEAIETAFVGYGYRWKIEEVHRQIKGDYDLEGICLQRYEALKAMNALLWAAVSFLYTRLDSLGYMFSFFVFLKELVVELRPHHVILLLLLLLIRVSLEKLLVFIELWILLALFWDHC